MTNCAFLHAPGYSNNGSWSFCPSISAAYLFVVLFGLATIAHLVEGIIYRKSYSIVIVIAAGWQTAGFIFRVLSIDNPWSSGDYSGWFILILTGPLWINAYVYMCMGRMVSQRVNLEQG